MIYNKTVIGFIVLIAIGGAAVVVPRMGTSVSFENHTATSTAEVVIEKESEYPDDVLERAERERENVLRQYKLEQEKSSLEAKISELEARVTEIDKEIGLHWADRANIVRLIHDTFPEDPHTATAIAKCESGLNIEAYNPNNSNGTVDRGIFQLNSVHDERVESLGLDPWDVEDNVAFARMLYEDSGFQPWVCYTRGMIAMI